MNCKKTLLTLLSMGACCALASCGSDNNETETSDDVLNFVAVTDTSWDTEVTIGSYNYQFDIVLKSDKKLSFDATCTSKNESNQNGGFPGFGADEDSTTEGEEETVDLTEKNFSFTGAWSLEEGYGYVLTFEDSAKTTIHTDFNKTQGRHEFYYLVTSDEGSSTVHFQAKDSEFRKSLASDYETWDIRDSTYIFTGETTGNNNSVALAYLYCHSDGSAVFNTASGSSRVITLGLTWAISGDTFTLTEGESSYVADNSINTDHPGYRISYSSTVLYASTSSSVSYSDMSSEDFDGKTLYQFTGSYTTSGPDGSTKEVNLNLTNNQNKMYMYTGTTITKKGTYTYESEVFTLTFENEEPVTVSKGEDGTYSYTFQITTSSFFGTSTVDVTLTYTPEA